METSKALRDEAGRFKELAEQIDREDLRRAALKIAERFERLAGKAETWDKPPKTRKPRRH